MAQRLAQGTHNPWVGSSNLSGPTTSERSACPSRAGGYASLCASTHPRKNLTRSIARSQCQTAGGTTVGPTREKVPASRWGRRMRLTRGATCEQCASLECGVCEARPRHSIAPSARRPRHSVASSGTTFLDNCAYADFCATRWRRVHDDRATQWRRVVRTCTAQLRGRRGGRYQTTARRPRTSGLPARRCQHLTYRASTTHDSRSDWGTHLLRWRSETGDWLRGRALPSHGRGRWFKSSIAHQTNSRSE